MITALPITDLAWHYFIAVQHRHHRGTLAALAQRLTQMLQARALYLRVGLTREYPHGSRQCWVQATSICTEPDDLEGYTFADYRAGLGSS